jgi:pimeloyl-ACP methyl ester carboxylesterase
MSDGLALAYAALHDARGVVIVRNSTWIRPFAELLDQLGPSLRDERFHNIFLRVFQPTLGLDQLQQNERELALSHQQISQDVVLAYWHELMFTDPGILQDRIDDMTGGIHAPVLALFGRQPVAEERDRFALLPAAKVEAWVGGGHFFHLADPDRFTQRLLAFVATCEQAASRSAMAVDSQE